MAESLILARSIVPVPCSKSEIWGPGLTWHSQPPFTVGYLLSRPLKYTDEGIQHMLVQTVTVVLSFDHWPARTVRQRNGLHRETEEAAIRYVQDAIYRSCFKQYG